MMVYDSNTGIPVSVMDASTSPVCVPAPPARWAWTCWPARTPDTCSSWVPANRLPFQIAATLLRPAIDKVYIADPMFPDNAVQFAAHIAQQLSDDFGIDASGMEFLPALDLAAAVGDSDAIITVTPSRKPIIQKAWLKPGTHLSCLGSDMESKQEIESTIFQGAAFYADDRAQCIRVGRWSCPSSRGVISADDITGEIGDLIDGKVPGRTSDTQTTIFDATGLYILDLAAAKVAIDRALAEGVGLQADL